jgi:hypothetical protein
VTRVWEQARRVGARRAVPRVVDARDQQLRALERKRIRWQQRPSEPRPWNRKTGGRVAGSADHRALVMSTVTTSDRSSASASRSRPSGRPAPRHDRRRRPPEDLTAASAVATDARRAGRRRGPHVRTRRASWNSLRSRSSPPCSPRSPVSARADERRAGLGHHEVCWGPARWIGFYLVRYCSPPRSRPDGDPR